ncbi:MAG: ATP-binding cassette domain-containing protein [Gemella haemolysans]|nr:ATP-binding cassette domain-containing protein [Gemella haemolysans]
MSGDSGVGKSTLFKIITGQLRKYEGSVEYCSVDLKKLSTKLFADSLSKADVPSSIKSIFLPLNNALAIANLWRCPPERFFP